MHPRYLAWTRESYIVCQRDLYMECACELERPPSPPHTERHRERGRGTDKVYVWMRAIELKIVDERENRSPGEGDVAFMHQRLI